MNLQLDRIGGLTSELKIPGVEANAVALAQQAAKEGWDYLQFLERILVSEIQERQLRKQTMFTRLADFP